MLMNILIWHQTELWGLNAAIFRIHTLFSLAIFPMISPIFPWFSQDFPWFFSKSRCPTAELRALLHQRREQLQVATQHGTGHGAQTGGAPEGLPGGRGAWRGEMYPLHGPFSSWISAWKMVTWWFLIASSEFFRWSFGLIDSVHQAEINKHHNENYCLYLYIYIYYPIAML